MTGAEIDNWMAGTDRTPALRPPALVHLTEAEDTLRAIGAGEVDAFLVTDADNNSRVFTLTTADRPYRMFVETMRDGAATLSSKGLILYANRRFAELLGRSRETIVGERFASFVSGGLPIDLDMRGPVGRGAIFELDLMGADKMAVPVLIGSSPLDVDDENLICLTFTDLSAQKAQEREIARLSHEQAERMTELQAAQVALVKQATHDVLTGLPNRSLLVDRIDQALAHAKRSGRWTTVLFVDLDRFKQVNDSRGHAAGDMVLKAVAERLTHCVRPMDTVARLGGDEFIVLAPEVDDRLHAVDIGFRLLAGLGQHNRAFAADGIPASIGIAVSEGGAGTSESLLREADEAMYQAKSLGGGRAEVFDAALREQIERRSAARLMLESALDEHRVLVHFQPIVDLITGAVSGFEALARIADPDGGIVHPGAFIPAAEDSGLVVPLGAQVLGLACQEARHWPKTSPRGRQPTVAVNLSSRQFEAGDLATFVRHCLELNGLDPSQLHLELTETAILDLRPEVLQQLSQMRDLGVEIGLDDFGTGYASLTHLRRLPLSFVKIDQSFVQRINMRTEDERIVAAVVDLGANLGLRSIAEGVETDDQLQKLRGLGCNQAQGYLFARPMPASDVPKAVARSAW